MSFSGAKYCKSCGMALPIISDISQLPQECSGCRSSEYCSPTPLAVALITVVDVVVNGGDTSSRFGVLCVHRRRKDPQNDPVRIALPGGYQIRNESLEQCVLRELYEETGVKDLSIVDLRYAGSAYSTSGNESLVFFKHLTTLSWKLVKMNFSPSDEVEDVTVLWFDDPEAPTLCFPTHQHCWLWYKRCGFDVPDSVCIFS